MEESNYRNKKILIVEDDSGLSHLIQKELERNKFEAEGARTGKEAIKWSEKNPDSLLLLDYKLPDMSAQDVIDKLKKKNINFYCIIITGHADIKIAVEMMRLGVKDYLVKDSNFLELLPTVIIRITEELSREKKLVNAELALYRSEESYRLLAENIIDVVWITDLGLRFIYINKPVNKLLGYKPEELINERLGKIFTKKSMELIDDFYTKVLKGSKSKRIIKNKNEVLELEHLSKDNLTVWTEVRISLMFDSKKEISGLLGVTRDITERKNTEIELKESFEKLRTALKASIEAMSKATEIRDPYTAGHQKRVGLLSYKIAKEMGLSDDDCEGIGLAGAIHDIGKIYVPAEILSKPGSISDNEFNIIKNHSKVGYDILKSIEFPWPIAKIVLQHHERINGSGYPMGINGDKMNIGAKIIAVADVVEAMASFRPYRPALGIDVALKEIKKNRKILYDPIVVDSCILLFEKKKFSFE